MQAQSAAVESTGQAKAEAQSRAEASRIEGEAAVQQATLKAKAAAIEAVCIFNLGATRIFILQSLYVMAHRWYNMFCMRL